MPQRIQRKRSKGWRMPEGAVYVGRPSRWAALTVASSPGHWVRPVAKPKKRAAKA